MSDDPQERTGGTPVPPRTDPIAWIDELVARAKVMEIADGWEEAARAALALPVFWMAGSRDNPEAPLFLDLEQGQALALFTSRERAAAFALKNELVTAGAPNVIEVPAPAALAHVRRTFVSGAPFVLFDAGATQWGYHADAFVALARAEGRLPEAPGEAEIDRLFGAYKKDPTRETDQALWGAVFRLAEWRFIARGEGEQKSPYTAMMNGSAYVLAFTSERLAHQFAARNKLERKGAPTTLGVDVDRAVKVLNELLALGVYAVLFDPDEHGFFAPLENVERMFHYFMARQSE